MVIGCLARFCSRSFGFRDRRAPDYTTRQLVAREGSAPPISGCRPDVMLFHHQAEIGCRGWTRTTTLAFKGRCPAIRRPGKVNEELRMKNAERQNPILLSSFERWWPARVTRPV